MKLADLHAELKYPEDGHPRILSMDCPCGGKCGRPLEVILLPKVPGGWKVVSGTTIHDISLTPSIQRMEPNGCHWHGFVTNGEAISC